MPKIQEEILDSFYARLEKLPEVDERIVTELRELFSADQKVKADDLVAIFARESEDDSP